MVFQNEIQQKSYKPEGKATLIKNCNCYYSLQKYSEKIIKESCKNWI